MKTGESTPVILAYLYRGTWRCGCAYVGQSVKPKQRWRQHETNPASWAIRDHMLKHGPPEWEIVGDENGYPIGEIREAEETMIDEELAAGTKLLNRCGVDYRSWKDGYRTWPVPGPRATKRQTRRYPRITKPQRCSNCHRRLHPDEFHSARTRSSGLSNRCKDCTRLFQRLYVGKAVRARIAKPYEELNRIVSEWLDAGMPGHHPGALPDE